MIRILACFLLLVTGIAWGQSPTPSPEASPSASPSATPEPSPSPTPDVDALIKGLSGAQIEKAISAIKTNYFQTDVTSDGEIQRALFIGLVERLGPGAEIRLESQKQEPSKPASFLSEILDSRVGYLRLGAISSESLAQMDTALKKFTDQGVKAVVVDLRGCPPSYDYEMGAEFARRFCKKGKLLFSIQKPSAKQERIFTSNQEPMFEGIVIAITDTDNMGAAEAIAAALRSGTQAMVVGEQTSGGAVEFTELNLGEGKILRIANAQVVLPDGENIYPTGVIPDIKVSIDPDAQKEIFRLSAEKGVSQFVFEKEHPRMNEAALVANTNPEIESIQEARRNAGNPALHDVALQRAVDLVTTIEFYKKQKQN